jgi:hypothetical protein
MVVSQGLHKDCPVQNTYVNRQHSWLQVGAKMQSEQRQRSKLRLENTSQLVYLTAFHSALMQQIETVFNRPSAYDDLSTASCLSN